MKIICKTNGFERRGGSGATGDGKSFDFNQNPLETDGFERRGGSGATEDGKSFEFT